MNAIRSVFFLFAGLSLSFAEGDVTPGNTATDFLDLKFGTEVVSEAEVPNWFSGVTQRSGKFLPDEGGWQVEADARFGVGRLVLELDRNTLHQDLALTLLYFQKDADLAIQLFDKDDRVVAVDLFANVVAINQEAKTDTAIIPLRQYPSASKIVIRRLKGYVNVQGAVLFPVLSETRPDRATLKDLVTLLGDPLSPDHPLLKGFASADHTPVRHEQMKAIQKATPKQRNSDIMVLDDSREASGQLELHLKGYIDGSDEVRIDREGATWTHKHWRYPTGMRINGIAWNPASTNRLLNSGETRFLNPRVDFASARVMLARGRDVCAVVPGDDHLQVHFSDGLGGKAEYELRVVFDERSPTTPPPGSDNRNHEWVALTVSAVVDGSSELHIDRNGARWRHKNYRFPENLKLNDVPWNPATKPYLPNTGATRFMRHAVDFSSARVLESKGRDVCAMLPARDKVIVFLSDSPNGKAEYKIRMAFKRIP